MVTRMDICSQKWRHHGLKENEVEGDYRLKSGNFGMAGVTENKQESERKMPMPFGCVILLVSRLAFGIVV